jgi:hypothetical protein
MTHIRRRFKMPVNQYAEKVVNDFVKDITDHIFCNIQHNELLMREYLDHVNTHGLQTVNMAIGKKVKEQLKLDNDGENDHPKSFLINSYTFHKL